MEFGQDSNVVCRPPKRAEASPPGALKAKCTRVTVRYHQFLDQGRAVGFDGQVNGEQAPLFLDLAAASFHQSFRHLHVTSVLV